MKSVTSIPSLNKAFQTLFTHSTTNPSLLHTLSRNLQNSHRPITLTFSLILRRQSHSLNHSFISSSKKPSYGVAKCLSSISSSPHTVDWNDAVSCSEIAEAEKLCLEREEDDDDASATAVKPYIPVRAFFFSTRFVFICFFHFVFVQNRKILIGSFCSVDLRSLVEQNKQNFVPPSSRMTNYVVLRFGDTKKAASVSVSFVYLLRFYLYNFAYDYIQCICTSSLDIHDYEGYFDVLDLVWLILWKCILLEE